MSASAAIFDLDRTLLAGASGPVLSSAMRAAGLMGPALPGERLLFGLFNAIGETLPGMALARQAATMAKGRSRVAVQAAARSAAGALVDLVQPYAVGLLAEHRSAGRHLVLATTTPFDLVKPLADALGFDEVIATRYAVNADGTYDGTIDGPFVWSTGKLGAVRDWASRAGVGLDTSWFYSDSLYDLPLLRAVGHPVVVNPDPRLALIAIAQRWPVVHLDVPPGVPKLPVLGVEPQQLAMALCRPELFPYARFAIEGTDLVPRTGGAIVCANHRSYFDVAAMAITLARVGRSVRFLGKKEVFDAPIIGSMAKAMGGIRVDRGTGSDEPLRAAADALDAGQLVAMMPQGTIPRGSAFFATTLKGRWGAARLAQLTGAPVVPVGLWGTEKVWPRSARVPQVWNLASPPKVLVRVGEAVVLKGKSLDADTRRIMQAISALLPPEAAVARVPTEAELALTYPPGRRPVRSPEDARRPGTD